MQNNSPIAICPTVDQEPSQQSAISSAGTPEADFITEPKPNTESVEVCEQAAMSIVKGILMEFAGLDWSSAHNLSTECF